MAKKTKGNPRFKAAAKKCSGLKRPGFLKCMKKELKK